jgi:hypothetical protein
MAAVDLVSYGAVADAGSSRAARGCDGQQWRRAGDGRRRELGSGGRWSRELGGGGETGSRAAAAEPGVEQWQRQPVPGNPTAILHGLASRGIGEREAMKFTRAHVQTLAIG